MVFWRIKTTKQINKNYTRKIALASKVNQFSSLFSRQTSHLVKLSTNKGKKGGNHNREVENMVFTHKTTKRHDEKNRSIIRSTKLNQLNNWKENQNKKLVLCALLQITMLYAYVTERTSRDVTKGFKTGDDSKHTNLLKAFRLNVMLKNGNATSGVGKCKIYILVLFAQY
ncbi:hypothetical protein TcasGA2_TC000072 [Tribolium castaneum]|uniref:Uncharacterized protein n=1 Tax=Tribolium castaneum TaxID=7070 RepID=D6WIT2_TRICA|nr:hypothetical protein TcasGA2_TC000072 [Tribolium castaneum]